MMTITWWLEVSNKEGLLEEGNELKAARLGVLSLAKCPCVFMDSRQG